MNPLRFTRATQTSSLSSLRRFAPLKCSLPFWRPPRCDFTQTESIDCGGPFLVSGEMLHHRRVESETAPSQHFSIHYSTAARQPALFPSYLIGVLQLRSQTRSADKEHTFGTSVQNPSSDIHLISKRYGHLVSFPCKTRSIVALSPCW